MRNDELKKVREEYTRLKNKTLLSYKSELLKLSKDQKVKRYIELSQLIDQYKEPSEVQVIFETYQNFPELFQEQALHSSHIMIYMGSYIKKDHTTYLTYERDPDTSYKSYKDLETTKVYHISKDECINFETEYLALYLPISEYSEEEYLERYLELQRWFKMQIIHASLSDVIDEMRKKYSRKYIELYPSFEKIETIGQLPIAEYVKNYPTEGFIETYCLSKEESMRVKLYRKQLNEEST